MRRTAFKHKPAKPMKRSGFIRSKRPKGEFPTYPQKPLKRTPLRKVSKKQAAQMRKYYGVRRAFLIANPACQICPCRGMKPAPATEVHHQRGRSGSLLCDTRGFIASCRSCREWPHENTAVARELGLLASPVEWGVSFDRLPD